MLNRRLLEFLRTTKSRSEGQGSGSHMVVIRLIRLRGSDLALTQGVVSGDH